MLAINQDPEVMAYFPTLQDLEMTKRLIDKINIIIKFMVIPYMLLKEILPSLSVLLVF